jgi:hypothetical protein
MTTKYLPQYNDTTGKSEGFKGTATGQVATWSEVGQEWVPGAGGGSGGGGEVFYFNFENVNVSPEGPDIPQSTTSTPSTSPSLLGPTYNPTTTAVTSANLSQTVYTLIAGFLTASGSPNAGIIPAGLWDFNVWAASTAATNGTQVLMQARVYIANAAGTQYGSGSGSNDQVPLASSDDVYLYEQATIAQYILNVTTPATVIDPTDRIYIEFWGKKTTNQTRTITLSFASNQPSHVHTTIPTLVNLATGVTGVLPLANGGTNKALTAATGQVAYSDADSLELTTGGTTGQFLKYNSGSAPTWADAAVASPYDFRGGFPGNPATNAILDRFVAARAFTISATESDQYFRALATTDGADVVITVKKNGTAVFTATFPSTATLSNGYYVGVIGTIDEAQDNVAVGDIITVEMGTTNAAFNTPIWTVYGTV